MAIIADSRDKRIAELLLERAVAVDRARVAEARVAELERDLANECERRDDIINCEVHLRGEAEARVAELEARLAL